MKLVKYDRAVKALAEAHSVDEVKDIRDQAVAMQVYAKQAKDHGMIEQATAIRMRAERRLGEMMAAQPKAQGRRTDLGFSETQVVKATLADAGIDKNLANRARRAAALSEDQFAEKVEQAKKNAISALNRATTDEKQEARAIREAELGAKIIAMPGNPYAVIYADPPWRFEPYSRDTGMDRAADNHYPTMTLDKIKELEVPTAPDAILFLWAIVPMLPEALSVMAAWGFEYVSSFVWVKDRIGTGYWTRNQHELLLIGTKGTVPAPAPGKQYPSVFQGPVGEHSAKPIAFRDAIEKMFPTLPRIELFAREKCAGWDVWGYEAPQQAAE